MNKRAMVLTLPLSLLAAAHALAEAPAGQAAEVCTTSTNVTVASDGKHIWAGSRLFTDAPALEVGKWLSDKPATEGKFLVVEFWRTWCGACKRMTPLMNRLQQKYGDELVVIGITGESEEAVKAYAGPKKEYCLALDKARTPEQLAAAHAPASEADAAPSEGAPCQAGGQRAAEQGQYEAAFDVWGWPHVVILEPQYRTVVWEGFPGLKGFELTEAKIEKILAIGRQMKAEAAAQKVPDKP
jgi:thiol-disulfide isomerase/thioredoxin